MQDGTYSLAEKNYSHGYRVTFSITVKDGKITEV
jgi:major membrane immunogen (membrane-anchored lipoprotein)